MQGRLSPLVDGKIQAFPTEHWRDEFTAGAALGFDLMEWTLDQEDLHQNPLMTREGRGEIKRLCRHNGLKITSATLDCVMQAPFYKAGPKLHDKLLNDLGLIIEAASPVDISTLVVPLVDDGTLTTVLEEEALRAGLGALKPLLKRTGVNIAFECDMPPAALAAFIADYSPDHFGLTYDIGNSAAAGFDADAEFAAYGPRIRHVHVKDRALGGTTVPLGEGNADFEAVFGNLHRLGYAGDYILQTARAGDDDHAAVLAAYRAQTLHWISAAAQADEDRA